jgi:hypothetical protein
MADVVFSISANVSKGSLSQSFAATGVTADMAEAGLLSVTLALGTNSTQIATTTLNAVGLCIARNLATSTTHTASFGRLDGTALVETVRLRAGEAAILRLAPGNYAARAAVAGTKLLVQVLED